MSNIKKSRAWERMIEEGLCATRADAERWILLRKAYLDDSPITSAGQMIPADGRMTLRGSKDKYTSKGGYKLEWALEAFGLDLCGRVAIDAGASTGGFTDCLVKHGCSLVYAVDVGYGQLHGSLRAHPAVVNLERTNISDPSLLALEPIPSLGTVDLSYLSLRKAAPAFSAILHQHGDLLCLVKPLFEIEDAKARREGVITDEAYEPLLHALCADLAREGLSICGVTHSPVTGNGGTIEFFVWAGLGSVENALSDDDRAARIARAVAAALSLERYKKQ